MNALVIAEKTITALDEAASSGLIAQREASQFKKMAMIAGAIKELSALLTPEVMKPIMELQGRSIGFRTDKDTSGGYPEHVVRDCLIEATLQGVYPVGNEFNIIAGRCYITKEGFGHKLSDLQGLSHMITPSVPVMKNGAAEVNMLIEWTYDHKQSSKNLVIAVRVNNGMGTDAIIGKATRKARAWLYTAVTGQEVGEGDVDDCIDIKATPVATSKPGEAYTPPEESYTTEQERVIESFSAINIYQADIEHVIGKEAKDFEANDIIKLRGMYAAIKKGDKTLSDYLTENKSGLDLG